MNRLLARVALLGLGAFTALSVSAQSFPSKPLTLIVPFAPGASADGIARIVARELSTELGQQVIVDNKPGGGGATGLILVSKAPPDGYTIGLGATGALAVNPHLPDAPPLKPEKELLPLAKLADIPLVFVTSPSTGYGNLQALISGARKNKGLTYGTAGQYTAQHLSGELLASMTGAPLMPVPYRGSAPAVTDVIGGSVPAAMVDLTAAYPQVKAGKLVALGVTSAQRSKVAPDIPTIAEEGVKGYAAPAWMGLFLPTRTPADVQARLSAALKKVMANATVQSQITALSAEPAYMDGSAFGRFIAAESKKWGEVVARIPAPSR
jgi:tripartite-type tricarboxylate transporter receptor subunit TctC